jgi:hypothetical protein
VRAIRLLHRISEDEMIATFLRAELDSDRWGPKLRDLLARNGRDEACLRAPDLGSVDENRYRRSLLEEHRAYERRDGLFGGFPPDVQWHRAALTPDEVLGILYINWDWWLRATEGTRRPADAARSIRAGEIPGVTVAEHEAVATTEPLIVVTTPALERFVVLEGHARLTALALFPERIPPELEVLLGISDEMAGWSEF